MIQSYNSDYFFHHWGGQLKRTTSGSSEQTDHLAKNLDPTHMVENEISVSTTTDLFMLNSF